MKKAQASYWDCMVMNCPHCGEENIDLLSLLTDWDGGGGPVEEDNMKCTGCKKKFTYFFKEP